MFKTNSINWKAVSFKDMIWIEAALNVDMEMQTKIKNYDLEVNVDIRALLKDIDDVQRIKASGKQNSVLKWSDLPSQAKNKEKAETNVELRKAFLKNLSEQFKNK